MSKWTRQDKRIIDESGRIVATIHGASMIALNDQEKREANNEIRRIAKLIQFAPETEDERDQLIGLFVLAKSHIPKKSVAHKMFDDLVQKIRDRKG